LPDSPSYSQICIRRINKLDIINNVIGMDIDDDGKNTVIAIDSTSIKVTNTEVSGWMRNGIFLTGKAISRSR